MNNLTRNTAYPQPTTSGTTTTNNSSDSSSSISNLTTIPQADSEQHQDTHMHTRRPRGAAAHQTNQTSTTTTLRTNNYFTRLPLLMAVNQQTGTREHRRRDQLTGARSGVAQQASRAPTTSNTNSTARDEARDRRRRLWPRGARTGASRNEFIMSIALVAATLVAIMVSGAVQVTEAKPVTTSSGQRQQQQQQQKQEQQQQQQYQLVQFRRLPPKEFSAALGSSIIIECEAGAAPPPAIHWLRNGARIHQNDLDDNQLDSSQQESLVSSAGNSEQISLSSTRSRLFIDCASLADEATYTCVAENAFSRVSTHTTLKIIRPVHVAAAEADLFAEDNELDNGAGELPGSALERSDADIELARAGPVPKRGVALDLETAEKSLSAVPQCLPNLHTSTTQAPLRIHMWTHNILERMKNSVLLYCRSNAANPTSTSQQSQEQQNNMNDDNNNNKRTLVTWTLPNDKQVEPNQNDKYEILSSGDLLIKDLRWSDMGSYICTVSNDQSSDSVSSFVYPSKRTWLVT